MRATAPPEVREQLETLQRDALALIRAVIDGYIARQAETRAPGAPDDRVEDIPIR